MIFFRKPASTFRDHALLPPKHQVAGCAALAFGLFLVARAGEARPWQPPVVGALGSPFEVAGVQQMLQRQAGASRGPGQRDPMDPFGRVSPQQDSSGGNTTDTYGVKVPDQSEMERARQIFEELRLRRNDPSRPRDERDYLDRLLKQF